MVLSKEGTLILFAIVSNSCKFSSIANSIAGLKSETLYSSKEGTPP